MLNISSTLNNSKQVLAKIVSLLKEEGLTRFGNIELDHKEETLIMLEPFLHRLQKIAELDKESRLQWIKQQNLFDYTYYERGVQEKKSLYENYRWMPELTLCMAHYLIMDLPINENDRVLDFGCAKGFLVKALRMLGIDAYGVDVSEYAIQNVTPDQWCSQCCRVMLNWELPFPGMKFDWIIAKDVLEHLTEYELNRFLSFAKVHSNKMLTVIPLGEQLNGKAKFIVPNYENDISHILRKPKEWWIRKFNESGWKVLSFSYNMRAIKENWTVPYPKGNGFFILRRLH